jgi:cytochrome c2
MKKAFFIASISVIFISLIFIQLNCSQNSEQKPMTQEEQIAHGKYLVNLGGCNDCHSPKVMSSMGPVPDTTKLLSGHPADEPLGEIDPAVYKKGQWVLVGATDFTSWVGPWGVSFTANLTPDNETGLGTWTPDLFIKALRTGKQLLPPMPWMYIGQCTDQDLKDIFAYLHSLPAIHNQVPAPIPPDKMAELFKKK